MAYGRSLAVFRPKCVLTLESLSRCAPCVARPSSLLVPLFHCLFVCLFVPCCLIPLLQEFARLRIGIGRPTDGTDIADYVLRDFSDAEQQQLRDTVFPLTAVLLDDLLDRGVLAVGGGAAAAAAASTATATTVIKAAAATAGAGTAKRKERDDAPT